MHDGNNRSVAAAALAATVMLSAFMPAAQPEAGPAPHLAAGETPDAAFPQVSARAIGAGLLGGVIAGVAIANSDGQGASLADMPRAASGEP